mmetsp:Transcript_105545/g.268139  ORF Transcript_105545/g.268139 Transcript_105545/m.268139 type:complete len:207 (+) Transcript_105545:46-666(+)
MLLKRPAAACRHRQNRRSGCLHPRCLQSCACSRRSAGSCGPLLLRAPGMHLPGRSGCSAAAGSTPFPPFPSWRRGHQYVLATIPPGPSSPRNPRGTFQAVPTGPPQACAWRPPSWLSSRQTAPSLTGGLAPHGPSSATRDSATALWYIERSRASAPSGLALSGRVTPWPCLCSLSSVPVPGGLTPTWPCKSSPSRRTCARSTSSIP